MERALRCQDAPGDKIAPPPGPAAGIHASPVAGIMLKDWAKGGVMQRLADIGRAIAGAMIGAVLPAGVPAAAALCPYGIDLRQVMAPEDLRAMAARAKAAPFPVGNFWRATRGDLELHLIGTMHLDDPRHDDLADFARPLIEVADIFFLETTRSGMEATQAFMNANPAETYIQDGPTMRELLDPEEWQRYAAAMEAIDVPPFMAALFQPWLAYSTLTLTPCILDAGLHAFIGLDERLHGIAWAADVEIASLEDPPLIHDLFDRLGPERGLTLLRKIILQAPDLEDIHTTTANAYFSGDHRFVWEFSTTFIAAQSRDRIDPEALEDAVAGFEDWILAERNRGWVTLLKSLPDGTRAVVAVGAAHLSGHDGVLDLLDRGGFALERLNGP